jgi:hypothetical protein
MRTSYRAPLAAITTPAFLSGCASAAESQPEGLESGPAELATNRARATPEDTLVLVFDGTGNLKGDLQSDNGSASNIYKIFASPTLRATALSPTSGFLTAC